MPRTRGAISCRRSGGWCAIVAPRGDGVRVDTGVDEGAEIGLYYDPMIAKLVAHGATRDEAIARLRAALDAFYHSRRRGTISTFSRRCSAKQRFAAASSRPISSPRNFPQGFAGRRRPTRS